MTKPIDIHTHLLNYEITPAQLYFGSREWNLKELMPLIHAYCDSDPIDDIAEWIYNLFASKDIDTDPVAKVFFTPLAEQHKLFEALPVTPVIMALDFRDVPMSDFYRSVVMAHEIAEDLCGHLAAGVDMTRTMQPLGAAVYKVYPALWTIEQHAEICRLSHERDRPIIAHASQGGIGRNKANNRPQMWWDALMEYPESVLCLAHAIGYNDEDWAYVEKMAQEFRFPNGDPRIYVDTAFVDGVKFDTTNYFNTLCDRLSGPVADGIMFGSDWPLHLVYYSIEELLDLHEKHLSPEQWEVISQVNPKRFLGVKS